MPNRDASSKRPPEEREEFFQGLRALRARKGLSLRDVAARIQIPADTLAEAETGPELPSLPILEAYLRGCEERLTPWEDWWRRLQPGTEATAALPVRDAGSSPAVLEGTLVGVSIGPADADLDDVVPWDTARHARPSGRRRGTLAVAAAVVLLLGGTGVVLLAQGSAGGGHAPRDTATQPPAAAPEPVGNSLLPDPGASPIPATTRPAPPPGMAAPADLPGTPAQAWMAAWAQPWTAAPTQPAPVPPTPVPPTSAPPTPVQPTPVPPVTSQPPVSPQPSVSPSATKTHCPDNQDNKGCGPKKGSGND